MKAVEEMPGLGPPPFFLGSAGLECVLPRVPGRAQRMSMARSNPGSNQTHGRGGTARFLEEPLGRKFGGW